jgi:hypothetical protein
MLARCLLSGGGHRACYSESRDKQGAGPVFGPWARCLARVLRFASPVQPGTNRKGHASGPALPRLPSAAPWVPSQARAAVFRLGFSRRVCWCGCCFDVGTIMTAPGRATDQPRAHAQPPHGPKVRGPCSAPHRPRACGARPAPAGCRHPAPSTAARCPGPARPAPGLRQRRAPASGPGTAAPAMARPGQRRACASAGHRRHACGVTAPPPRARGLWSRVGGWARQPTQIHRVGCPTHKPGASTEFFLCLSGSVFDQ